MFSRSALLATVTLALAAAANPIVQIRDAPVSLPIAKRLNFTGTVSLLERDQKHAQALKNRANAKLNGQFVEAAAGSVPATNQLVDYVVNVGVGSPATTCKCSNPWIPDNTGAELHDRLSLGRYR